jgi:hypothetical protein
MCWYFYFFELFRGLTAKEVWAMLNLVTPIAKNQGLSVDLCRRQSPKHQSWVDVADYPNILGITMRFGESYAITEPRCMQRRCTLQSVFGFPK